VSKLVSKQASKPILVLFGDAFTETSVVFTIHFLTISSLNDNLKLGTKISSKG
jgi:hypothetical protein